MLLASNGQTERETSYVSRQQFHYGVWYSSDVATSLPSVNDCLPACLQQSIILFINSNKQINSSQDEMQERALHWHG